MIHAYTAHTKRITNIFATLFSSISCVDRSGIWPVTDELCFDAFYDEHIDLANH